MSLSTIRAALKTRLETITDLKVYAEVPDAVEKFPTAIIQTATANYEVALGGSGVTWTFRILLLIGDRDSNTAHTTLDGYLSRTGSTSIPAAIRGGTVGDGRAFIRRAENVGFMNYRGTTFIGAEFIVDVDDSS